MRRLFYLAINNSRKTFWHCFLDVLDGENETEMLAIKTNGRVRQLRKKDVNKVISLAVSFMLNGVPPIVCETVLEEVVTSIKRKVAASMN